MQEGIQEPFTSWLDPVRSENAHSRCALKRLLRGTIRGSAPQFDESTDLNWALRTNEGCRAPERWLRECGRLPDGVYCFPPGAVGGTVGGPNSQVPGPCVGQSAAAARDLAPHAAAFPRAVGPDGEPMRRPASERGAMANVPGPCVDQSAVAARDLAPHAEAFPRAVGPDGKPMRRSASESGAMSNVPGPCVRQSAAAARDAVSGRARPRDADGNLLRYSSSEIISGVSLEQGRADRAAAELSKAELTNQICSLLATGMIKAAICSRLRVNEYAVRRAAVVRRAATSQPLGAPPGGGGAGFGGGFGGGAPPPSQQHAAPLG